ncbi:MAG: hypothetical protein E7011_04995 [Alphaproteobacteria bacterium]|nr:hypothetical protein [Alphaproteobacteria bacterium]
MKHNDYSEITDGKTIAHVVHALSNLDNTVARKLIQHPQQIKTLISGEHNLQCPYALHAITMALVSDNCHSILTEMSDSDIATLRSCLELAQQRAPLPSTIIQENIRKRQNKLETLTNQAERTECKHMLNSLNISAMVNTPTFWNDSINELKKWTMATQKHTENTKPHTPAPVKDAGYLTLTQLAKQFGVLRYQICNHIAPYLNGKKQGPIAEWFTEHNGVISLDTKHLEDYKKAFASRNCRVAKTTGTSKKTRQSTSSKQSTPRTLVDLQALTTYVNKLKELLDRATQEHQIHKEKSKNLRTAIAQEESERNISRLLTEITTVNNQVL